MILRVCRGFKRNFLFCSGCFWSSFLHLPGSKKACEADDTLPGAPGGPVARNLGDFLHWT